MRDNIDVDAAFAELKELFGSPLLGSESAATYDRIMRGYLECFMPKDFHEKMLMGYLCNYTWDIIRLMRLRPLVIERRCRQQLAFDAQRKKQLAKRKAAVVGERTDRGSPPGSELERAQVLEDAAWDAFNQMEGILEHAPKDMDYARALAANIDLCEQIDDLLTAAQARQCDTVEQFELYREGLGSFLQRTSEQIIHYEWKKASPEIAAMLDAEAGVVPLVEAQAASGGNVKADLASTAPSIAPGRDREGE